MSEHGFYHPSVGYWQATDDVPSSIFESYPHGTCEVPIKPGVGYSLDQVDRVWIKRPLTLDEMRDAKTLAIVDKAGALLSTGAPAADGLHVAMDDGSRADLTAMAATATVALSGTVLWPESYARGWITIENVRIPLATPADGLALAAAVGNYYAAIVQHRRDLKDAALAALDEAALEAIDVAAGWPVP